jgi:hypothetical protein
VANINATFMEQVFDLSQRKRIPNIHHHRQTDDRGRRLKISEWIFHQETFLNPRRRRLKPDSPNTAVVINALGY